MNVTDCVYWFVHRLKRNDGFFHINRHCTNFSQTKSFIYIAFHRFPQKVSTFIRRHNISFSIIRLLKHLYIEYNKLVYWSTHYSTLDERRREWRHSSMTRWLLNCDCSYVSLSEVFLESMSKFIGSLTESVKTNGIGNFIQPIQSIYWKCILCIHT